MRSLEARLNRVVRMLHQAVAECKLCGGNAGSVLRITIDDEPMRPVEACP